MRKRGKPLAWPIRVLAVAIAAPFVVFFQACELAVFLWDRIRGQR